MVSRLTQRNQGQTNEAQGWSIGFRLDHHSTEAGLAGLAVWGGDAGAVTIAT